MTRRIITVIFVVCALTFGASVLWSAHTDEQDGDTAANIVSANDSPTGESTEEAPKKKKGNRFARIFKAPFKAVGRLFTSGDDRKLARMTAEDAEKFETVGVTRVEDARTAEATEPAPSASVTARDHVMQGRAYLESGQLNAAIAELSRATSLDPRLSQAHSLLAVAYDRKGLHERARESYERAIAIDDDDAQTLNNLGYSLYLNGNYRAAVDRLKRAARLAPNDSRILNNLGLAQCRLGRFDDAYKSFARAGGEYQGRMNTAALLSRMGRDEEALKHYEAARRLQPANATVLRRLVDLYERTGRAEQAADARRELQTADGDQAARAEDE